MMGRRPPFGSLHQQGIKAPTKWLQGALARLVILSDHERLLAQSAVVSTGKVVFRVQVEHQRHAGRAARTARVLNPLAPARPATELVAGGGHRDRFRQLAPVVEQKKTIISPEINLAMSVGRRFY